MTTAKTLAVFAIIFGCFAILYPKIFHPMLLNIVGSAPDTRQGDDLSNRVPPHLRRPGGGARATPNGGPPDDFTHHMRGGPHPGMRAAAEMKKQAAATQGGSGKGMMAVVLPMYACGIVIYLVYTMIKVFGKGKKEDEKDYMASHFKDGAGKGIKPQKTQQQQKIYEDSDEDLDDVRQNKKRQKDLERLLIKADKDKISNMEMQQLKRRLLETEAQMSRILAAMDSVSDKITTVPQEMNSPMKKSSQASTPDSFDKVSPGSSPDIETYEVISSKTGIKKSGHSELPVEDILPTETSGLRKRGKVEEKQTEENITNHKSEENVNEELDDSVEDSNDEEISSDDERIAHQGDESEKESQDNNGTLSDEYDKGHVDDYHAEEDEEDDDSEEVEYGDDDIEEELNSENESGCEGTNDSEKQMDNQPKEEANIEHQDLRKRKAGKLKPRRDE